MVRAAQRIVEAMGLDNCPFHLECRLLSDGSVKLLEIAARPGGGFITSHLIPFSTELPFHANCIRVATGEAPDMSAPGTLYAGRRSVIGHREGSFDGLDGIEGALRVWGVEHVVLERPFGSPVVLPPLASLSSTLASVIARGATHAETRQLLARAAAEIKPKIR
jgi:biotin carboxylase